MVIWRRKWKINSWYTISQPNKQALHFERWHKKPYYLIKKPNKPDASTRLQLVIGPA
jgi:hypothetical protein